MNRVALDTVSPQAWRNGGGSTRELLVWPEAADWALRVSVATIAQDGDFSAWPGMDRWFAVVDGAGVVLGLPSGAHTLGVDSPPLAFDGAAAPGCRLVDGPTLDLNLMLRRERGGGGLRRAAAGSHAQVDAAWQGLYTADPLTLARPGQTLAVDAGTLLWTSNAALQDWAVADTGARAWWLHWTPR